MLKTNNYKIFSMHSGVGIEIIIEGHRYGVIKDVRGVSVGSIIKYFIEKVNKTEYLKGKIDLYSLEMDLYTEVINNKYYGSNGITYTPISIIGLSESITDKLYKHLIISIEIYIDDYKNIKNILPNEDIELINNKLKERGINLNDIYA